MGGGGEVENKSKEREIKLCDKQIDEDNMKDE